MLGLALSLTDKWNSLSTPTGTAYEYYRFQGASDNFVTPTADGRTAIWDIEGYESTNLTGTNQFVSDQLSVLGETNPTNDQYAFNGDHVTGANYWDSFAAASGVYRWIYVRMNTARIIRSIRYYARFEIGNDAWTPQTINVEGSNNGTNWDLITTLNMSDTLSAQEFTSIQ